MYYVLYNVINVLILVVYNTEISLSLVHKYAHGLIQCSEFLLLHKLAVHVQVQSLQLIGQ